jgi:hypothetical protein
MYVLAARINNKAVSSRNKILFLSVVIVLNYDFLLHQEDKTLYMCYDRASYASKQQLLCACSSPCPHYDQVCVLLFRIFYYGIWH